MGRLTTHVLDTAHGCPGAGITLRLYAEGKGEPVLSGERMRAGRYVIAFEVGEYFRRRGVAMPDPAFLETVRIAFGIADAAAHYHVPLLVSPFAYSTYRGS
jgi:5-hydroxyisourate hydrolase